MFLSVWIESAQIQGAKERDALSGSLYGYLHMHTHPELRQGVRKDICCVGPSDCEMNNVLNGSSLVFIYWVLSSCKVRDVSRGVSISSAEC